LRTATKGNPLDSPHRPCDTRQGVPHPRESLPMCRLLPLFLLLAVTGCNGGWHTYSDPAGRFAVEAPGPFLDHPESHITHLVLQRHGITYSVRILDAPPGVRLWADEMQLDRLRDDVLTESDSKLLGEGNRRLAERYAVRELRALREGNTGVRVWIIM